MDARSNAGVSSQIPAIESLLSASSSPITSHTADFDKYQAHPPKHSKFAVHPSEIILHIFFQPTNLYFNQQKQITETPKNKAFQ